MVEFYFNFRKIGLTIQLSWDTHYINTLPNNNKSYIFFIWKKHYYLFR